MNDTKAIAITPGQRRARGERQRQREERIRELKAEARKIKDEADLLRDGVAGRDRLIRKLQARFDILERQYNVIQRELDNLKRGSKAVAITPGARARRREREEAERERRIDKLEATVRSIENEARLMRQGIAKYQALNDKAEQRFKVLNREYEAVLREIAQLMRDRGKSIA